MKVKEIPATVLVIQAESEDEKLNHWAYVDANYKSQHTQFLESRPALFIDGKINPAQAIILITPEALG